MTRRRLAVTLGGMVLLSAGAARAQAIDMSSGGPVQVTAAGGFEWHETEQTVIAQGDARATRGNVTVLADRMLARYRKKAGAPTPAAAPSSTANAAAGIETGDSEVYRLEADGHVRIVTPTDEAVGDRAVYDIDQAVLVLTGRGLKLTTPQQIMTARDSMEYWSQRRMAVGRGDAVVNTTDARRLAADILVGYFAAPSSAPSSSAAPSVKPVAAQAPPAPQAPPADPVGASGKLERVEAFGNVVVRTTTDTVRGDRGVYVPDTGLARVVGHVRITHGQNQINGPAADVNMKTGIAHMLGASEGERVQGLIMPNDTQSRADIDGKPK